MPDHSVEALESAIMSMPGWCTQEKFRRMHDLVVEAQARVCVEIGVFGGRSLIALAAGCRAAKSGHAWGVDPYAAASGIEGYEGVIDKPSYDWWARLDYEAVYNGCLASIRQLGLAEWCTIVRKTAEAAVGDFETIDMLHIDGNHTEKVSTSDVRLYVPKVKPGGYVWFDDVHWASVKKALEQLRQSCDDVLIAETYGLFRKRGGRDDG